MKRAQWVSIAIWLVFAAVVLDTAFRVDRFVGLENIANVGRQMSINAIISAGMTMVILTGGIDLSVGSVLAFASVLTGMMLKAGVPIPLAIALGVATGAALGGVNGSLVALVRLPPFVVTLAMMAMARSHTRVVTGNVSIYDLPAGFSILGGAIEWGGVRIPVPLLLTVAVYAWAWALLRHYRFGRHVYAIGGNEEAARLSGVPVARTKLLVYVACGALSAFAGVIATSRLGAADPTVGIMFELDAIAAVVIGGASLMGGRGHIAGTLLGVLVVAVLRNIMTLRNIDPNWQGLVQGLVILGAVLASRWKR